MSTVPLKNKYKLPGTGKEIPYQGYGYGSVFNVPAIFTNPGQGQYPGGTPPTFPPGSGYPPGYPPVDPRTLPTIPQRQRGPQPGELRLPTPNPDQNRVITPGEAAQIPADTGPGRFDPDLINKGYPAPYDPGGWGGANPPPPGTVGQQPPAPGAPRGGIGGFFDKLTSSPNVESMYTAGSILAGNPQPNESQMQQVIRSIGGAMSTRGAYAQMQRAQAEAARKADLERRKVQVEEQNARTQAATQDAAERQKDNEGDLAVTTQNDTRAHQVRADEATTADSKSLGAWRDEQIARSKKDAERLQKEYELDEREYKNKVLQQADKHGLDILKAGLDNKRLAIELMRARAYALSVKSQAELFRNLKYWDRAVKIAGGSEGLDLLGKTSNEQYDRMSEIMDDVKAQDEGATPEMIRQRRQAREAKRAAGEGGGGGGGKVDAKGRPLDAGGYYEGQVVDDEKGTGWVRRNGGWVPEKR